MLETIFLKGKGLIIKRLILQGLNFYSLNLLGSKFLGFNWTKDDFSTFDKKVLNYHRMVEAFKFSYALRPHLGDPSKIPRENEADFQKVKSIKLTTFILSIDLFRIRL